MKDAWAKAVELMTSHNAVLETTINTTLTMAFASSLSALVLGALIGLAVASNEFPGKRVVVMIMRTLMGLPPVVVGIVVYILFSGTGPFGNLRLIYSVELMIIAQVVLITPIVAGMTETALTPIVNRMRPTLKGLRAGPLKTLGLTVAEGKYQLMAVYLFAFARAISEVGAIQIVGGNILYKTRTMTTTIALNYNTGEFSMAVALGFILLLIALAVNLAAALLQLGLKNEMIEITAKKTYGKRTVLNINGLVLEEGLVYAVIGSNGSGKTTLIQAIAGLIPYEGKISLGTAKRAT